MNLIRNLAILLLIAATPAAVLAQFETATVLGTVRDATNAVVPDATVTLTNTATSVSDAFEAALDAGWWPRTRCSSRPPQECSIQPRIHEG